MSTTCSPFDSQLETITEFLERFKIQCSTQLEKVKDDGVKQAAILVSALPISIITDLQRRFKPRKLSAASLEEIEALLISQFSVKQSIVGASRRFLSYKQSPDQSIESYAKCLNDLAAACQYTECCRDRMLRDVFVSGLISGPILRAVLQACEDKTFNECVNLAKLSEQTMMDAQDMKNEATQSSTERVHTTISKNSVPENYTCIRCGAKRKHFASDCFALKKKCNFCKKFGHLEKVCKGKQRRSHAVQDTGHDNDDTGGDSEDTSSEEGDAASSGHKHRSTVHRVRESRKKLGKCKHNKENCNCSFLG